MSNRLMRRLSIPVSLTVLLLAGSAAAKPYMGLPSDEDRLDVYLYKDVQIPQGKILRAWTAIDSAHQHVLYINGKVAARSGMGRTASVFRRSMEIDNIADCLKPGSNKLVMKVHRWTAASSEAPDPRVYIESEVQVKTPDGVVNVPIIADASWVGSFEAPANWNSARFVPNNWRQVTVLQSPTSGPRIRKEQLQTIKPDVPAPLLQPALREFPQIREMSDWQQQVVARDRVKDTERLMKVFQTKWVAESYANAINRSNTRMGDSKSINGYPVGNGIVFTIIGAYSFFNCGGILGPEYQYPVQWQPGTTFGGDTMKVTADGKPLQTADQWMWKIRKTDVVVTAAAGPNRDVVFYTLTFAPPDLKAMIRVYMVANASDAVLKDVVVINQTGRAKPKGKTLTETIARSPQLDAAGDKNTRTIISGVLDDAKVTATYDETIQWGSLTIPLGDIAPGQAAKTMVYHVTYLETVNDRPVESDAQKTLKLVTSREYKLLDDTIEYWRNYNTSTTTLEAPGPWGTRVADFIDDVKMLVQVQQFKRTGAVGPMSFFSDQWIRDACGPLKSFARTGAHENARRILDYHYLSAIAAKKILNWLPMDVDVYNDFRKEPWSPVEDWTKITMNHADRHANCEVASWIIKKHHWYFRFSGDTKTISEHWEYLKRSFYGQFDNKHDKIFRPDFKMPFHGDETFIYSGGEALWPDRYDLLQTSYPGGNISSADSSFELVAAGDALVEMGRAIGKEEDAAKIADVTSKIREVTEEYYWMQDLGFYAQGMSLLFDGQLNRFPMGNILANVTWSGYASPKDEKTVSSTLRMMEYLIEDTGVMNPIIGIDNTVGMLQGQALYAISAINHPWAEKAFYALLMIAGDTTEFSEWMAVGADYNVMYRANRIRPWEAGINLDAALYYLTGFEPDAFNKRMTLIPRLPTGSYSPIKWDNMTLKHLPMGSGSFDLTVADIAKGNKRQRTYTLTGHIKEDTKVTLNALVPFAKIDRVAINGRRTTVEAGNVFSQALASVEASLPAGETLTVSLQYRPQDIKPVDVEMKSFTPSEPVFENSDIVIFTALHPNPNGKLLREVLAEKYKVVAIDASLPTDPATFRAALLTRSGIKTRMLILSQNSMVYGRKHTFWWDPQFDEIVGTFLKRGG